MHYSDQGDFTCGPRHRQVVRTYRFPWVRALLSIVALVAACVFGLLLMTGTAHAGTVDTVQLKTAAERLNDRCRDQANAQTACELRDKALQELRGRGVCWNAKAATPAALWVPCAAPRAVLVVDNELARCAAQAAKLDAITRFRDTGAPPRMVVEWGYSAEDVVAVYSGKVSSYRGAAYCYTLRNIEAVRRAS